jgi:hypothetical protein
LDDVEDDGMSSFDGGRDLDAFDLLCVELLLDDAKGGADDDEVEDVEDDDDDEVEEEELAAFLGDR